MKGNHLSQAALTEGMITWLQGGPTVGATWSAPCSNGTLSWGCMPARLGRDRLTFPLIHRITFGISLFITWQKGVDHEKSDHS
jgi:hypothetical protein